jgi:hypothetical protein
MNKMELHIAIDKTDYWASAIVCARTNAILKVMKVISVCHHDCSPDYF